MGDDVATWAATQTVGAEVPSWSRVSALPLATWAYDDVLLAPRADGAQATALLRYRLRGEPSDSALPVALTLTRQGSGWVVTRETATSAARPLWDLGDVVVATSGPVTAVGVGVGQVDVDALAHDAARAGLEVEALWAPVPEVVVVLTSTRAALAAGLGRPVASLAGLSAVTSADGTAPGVQASDATSRVWLDRDDWSRLGPDAHGVVLRHELLHVVTAAAATSTVPLWLEEGAGELVGYDGSGIPLATAVRDELARVRRDGAPAQLPTDAQLAGPRAREAYQGAHVAVAVLVDEVGLDGLRRLYAAVAGSAGTPESLDRALSDVTGDGTEALTRRWQERLRALVAG